MLPNIGLQAFSELKKGEQNLLYWKKILFYHKTLKSYLQDECLLCTFRNPWVWYVLRDPKGRCPTSNHDTQCRDRVRNSKPGKFLRNKIEHALLAIVFVFAYGTSSLRHGRIQWQRTTWTGFGSRNEVRPKRDGWRPFRKRVFLFEPNQCPEKSNTYGISFW